MNEVTVQDVHEFLNQLPESARDVSWDVVLNLVRNIERYRRFCNLQLEKTLEGWEVQRFKQTQQNITLWAARLGCVGVEFDEDVRGASVFLVLPSGRTNDMADRGWIVPALGGKND